MGCRSSSLAVEKRERPLDAFDTPPPYVGSPADSVERALREVYAAINGHGTTASIEWVGKSMIGEERVLKIVNLKAAFKDLIDLDEFPTSPEARAFATFIEAPTGDENWLTWKVRFNIRLSQLLRWSISAVAPL